MRGARPLVALERSVARSVAAQPGEVLVVATSGGPDSVALAALLQPAAEAAGATLVLAHVNHVQRASAWQDEAVVLALGATLRVRAFAVSLEPGGGAEGRLRDERYAALARIARDVGARRICTAHHAQDQTETVLLALLRGAGPAGLAGMPVARPLAQGVELVRPLLAVEPLDLREYCAARHLAFALDPTNGDVSFRRNAVRASLATLRESFPHLDAAVARCAGIIREERAGSPRSLARERVRSALAGATGDLRDVTFERLDAAAAALEAGAPGRHFLRRGVEFIVE